MLGGMTTIQAWTIHFTVILGEIIHEPTWN